MHIDLFCFIHHNKLKSLPVRGSTQGLNWFWGLFRGPLFVFPHLSAVTASQITVPQISKSLNPRDQCTPETTNRVSSNSDETEMRKRRRQAIERQEGDQEARGKRKLNAVTTELFIRGAGSFYWFVGAHMERICQCLWHWL